MCQCCEVSYCQILKMGYTRLLLVQALFRLLVVTCQQTVFECHKYILRGSECITLSQGAVT